MDLSKSGILEFLEKSMVMTLPEPSLAHIFHGTRDNCWQAIRFSRRCLVAGCVLFELITGKHAFTCKSREELFSFIQFWKLPRESFSCFSTELSDLLLKMLNKNPILRPTCSQILRMPIIRNALARFRQKVSATALCEKVSSTENLLNLDETEVDQTDIPDWIKDVPAVASELMRQSFRRAKDDINRFAEIIKSSISDMKVEGNVDNMAKVECNLVERRKRLESECRMLLGDERYRIRDSIRNHKLK